MTSVIIVNFKSPALIEVPDPEHRFTGLPLIVQYCDGVEWALIQEVSYHTNLGETLTVRVPFVFDFASVPRVLGWLYSATGQTGNPYGIAALIHDWLYCHRKIGGRVITRAYADDVFYEVMRYTGCRHSLAVTMWLAVRMGGWVPWDRRKPEDVIP